MKYHQFFMLALGWVGFLSSCSPMRVQSTELDADTRLENYETFNFYDISLDSPDSIPIDESRLSILKDAITNQFNSMGITMSDDPELWVNLGILIEEKIQTRETDIRDAPMYIGQRNYHWEAEEIPIGKYRDGTVTMDLIDAESKRMIGQAVASGVIVEDDEELEQRINEGMEVVFSRLLDD